MSPHAHPRVAPSPQGAPAEPTSSAGALLVSRHTAELISEIVEREKAARERYLPVTPEPRPADRTTAVHFSEAGLAILAAHVHKGRKGMMARRRAIALMSDGILKLLRWRTLAEVAAEARMELEGLRDILAGVRKPKLPMLKRVASALRVPPAVLFEHLDALPPLPTTPRGRNAGTATLRR